MFKKMMRFKNLILKNDFNIIQTLLFQPGKTRAKNGVS